MADDKKILDIKCTVQDTDRGALPVIDITKIIVYSIALGILSSVVCNPRLNQEHVYRQSPAVEQRYQPEQHYRPPVFFQRPTKRPNDGKRTSMLDNIVNKYC